MTAWLEACLERRVTRVKRSDPVSCLRCCVYDGHCYPSNWVPRMVGVFKCLSAHWQSVRFLPSGMVRRSFSEALARGA